MQWIDYALLGIILISTVVSAFRGLIKEILSMLAWAVAFFVAMKFYKPLTQFITFTDDQSIRVVIALFGLFIGTLMIIGFVNYIITLVIKKTGLSGTDRVLGMFFGLLRGGAIVLVAACTLQLAFNYGFLLKLKEEGEGALCFFIEVLKSYDQETKASLCHDKFSAFCQKEEYEKYANNGVTIDVRCYALEGENEGKGCKLKLSKHMY